MTKANQDLTIVLNHPAAESYASLIEERFPTVRTIVAADASDLEKNIGDADAVLAFRFPVEVFDKAKKLRWFQCTGAGVDSLYPIRDKVGHITVTNARGIHGEIIADFVMAGVTMLHWDFRRFLQEQERREWQPRYVAPLGDRTLGVIGLGSIGATIARRAKSAGMTVVGSKRDISQPVDGVDRLFAADAFDEFLPLCDFVVLALPSTPDTIGVIGASHFEKMKRSAFLVNIARGNVLVESELVAALQEKTIAGALLDVFEKEPLPSNSPLWGMPNVIATPHVAGSPTNYTERVFSILAENIENYLNGRPLKNVVDLSRGY
ncbi:D-isomer specific 2-hydroxyacid dehydrogenase family protein [Neorhizobium galegae bv. officinalis]|nr:D-2-hydroxyacid dehydrogenase [Neorhizobium galegae]CDZ40801.1 D-isomer specific 2-hydroxyacid dehydrogenase family protein [Neorhizobium galegae bv. officinalis]